MENEIKNNTYTFVLPFLPAPKGRPRVGKFGVYTPKKTRDSENQIKDFIFSFSKLFFEQPTKMAIGVELQFTMIRPKSSKKKYPTVKPDIDNLIKTLLDAMNGIIYADDNQIIDLSASSRYGEEEKTKIKLILIE